LYTIIAFSCGDDGYLFFDHRIPYHYVFTVPLEPRCNFAFTPTQFGLRNNILAA